MFSSKSFKTKTEFLERKNGNVTDKWEIGIDAGYSSIKVCSPNCAAMFPSFAKKVGPGFEYTANIPDDSILYKNNTTGEIWLVGEIAQDTMEDGDTSDSVSQLYSRDRYISPMFNVLVHTGLAIGRRDNRICKYGGQDIIIQSGLPERYLSDEGDLREVFAGRCDCSIKIGGGNWENFQFDIKDENVHVMSQPKGTLFSVCIDGSGKFTRDASFFLENSGIVFDGGFGTLDIKIVGARGINKVGETFSDLGMRRVLEETSQLIKNKYGVDISVPRMQKYLETGEIRYVDRKSLKTQVYDFSDLLMMSSIKVCDEAVKCAIQTLDLSALHYIIITGGTGAAWCEHLKDRVSDLCIRVEEGNLNDDLPLIYSNVRGYYFYRRLKDMNPNA